MSLAWFFSRLPLTFASRLIWPIWTRASVGVKFRKILCGSRNRWAILCTTTPKWSKTLDEPNRAGKHTLLNRAQKVAWQMCWIKFRLMWCRMMFSVFPTNKQACCPSDSLSLSLSLSLHPLSPTLCLYQSWPCQQHFHRHGNGCRLPQQSAETQTAVSIQSLISAPPVLLCLYQSWPCQLMVFKKKELRTKVWSCILSQRIHKIYCNDLPKMIQCTLLRGAWSDRDTNDIFAHCSLIFYYLDFKFSNFVCPYELHPLIWFFLKNSFRKKKNIRKTSKNALAPSIFIVWSIVLKLGTPLLHIQAQNTLLQNF